MSFSDFLFLTEKLSFKYLKLFIGKSLSCHLLNGVARNNPCQINFEIDNDK